MDTTAKSVTTMVASDSTVNTNTLVTIIVGVLVVIIVASLLLVFLIIILCFMKHQLKVAKFNKNSTERNGKFI